MHSFSHTSFYKHCLEVVKHPKNSKTFKRQCRKLFVLEALGLTNTKTSKVTDWPRISESPKMFCSAVLLSVFSCAQRLCRISTVGLRSSGPEALIKQALLANTSKLRFASFVRFVHSKRIGVQLRLETSRRQWSFASKVVKWRRQRVEAREIEKKYANCLKFGIFHMKKTVQTRNPCEALLLASGGGTTLWTRARDEYLRLQALSAPVFF